MPEMVHALPIRVREDDPEMTAVLCLNATPLAFALVNAVSELARRSRGPRGTGMTGWVENPPLAPDALPQGGQGGDIWILWDNTQGLGDWGLALGDILTGQDLETACLTSLFSDALATPDFVPTDGTTDRRGWSANTYLDIPLGSNLWQLDRARRRAPRSGAPAPMRKTRSIGWSSTASPPRSPSTPPGSARR